MNYFLYVSGRHHCELNLHVSVNNNVYQREQQLAQDILHEDGGCLAVVQPAVPLHSGADPHLHGHSQR